MIRTYNAVSVRESPGIVSDFKITTHVKTPTRESEARLESEHRPTLVKAFNNEAKQQRKEATIAPCGQMARQGIPQRQSITGLLSRQPGVNIGLLQFNKAIWWVNDADHRKVVVDQSDGFVAQCRLEIPRHRSKRSIT